MKTYVTNDDCPPYVHPFLTDKEFCARCRKWKDEEECFTYDAHFGPKRKNCDECYEIMGYDVYMKDRNVTDWFDFKDDFVWPKVEFAFFQRINIKKKRK